MRDAAAEKLLYILPRNLYSLEKDPHVGEENLDDIRKLKALIRSEEALPTDLLRFKHIFARYMDPRYLDV